MCTRYIYTYISCTHSPPPPPVRLADHERHSSSSYTMTHKPSFTPLGSHHNLYVICACETPKPQRRDTGRYQRHGARADMCDTIYYAMSRIIYFVACITHHDVKRPITSKIAHCFIGKTKTRHAIL